MVSNKAVLFFARDYLADAFPDLSKGVTGYDKVFITLNKREAALVKGKLGAQYKVDSFVYCIEEYGLKSIDKVPFTSGDLAVLADGIGNERCLGKYDVSYCEDLYRVLRHLIEDIFVEFQPVAYFDEPVSTFYNYVLNKCLSSRGVRCAHFHTAWVPGYVFFSADPSHKCLYGLNGDNDGEALVKSHYKKRRSGTGAPKYVIGYGSLTRRIRDMVKMFGKGVYRKYVRSSASYLDIDPWADFFHSNCLFRSTFFSSVYRAPKQLAGRKFIVFPMHYEPEAVLCYFSKYSRQTELVNSILDNLPWDCDLVLKEHPSQPGALKMGKWKDIVLNGRIYGLQGTDVLPDCCDNSPVITIGSTMGVESALKGVPVAVLADVHYRAMPGITSVENLADIALALEQCTISKDAQLEWYAKFLNQFCVKGQFMRSSTYIDDFDAVLKAVIEGRGPVEP